MAKSSLIHTWPDTMTAFRIADCGLRIRGLKPAPKICRQIGNVCGPVIRMMDRTPPLGELTATIVSSRLYILREAREPFWGAAASGSFGACRGGGLPPAARP